MPTRLLITGGAGFVGSNLALMFKAAHPDWQVRALDNLSRRGSELALTRLGAAGVEFLRGDVRRKADIEAAGDCDLLIECSAEPSVHAGYGEDPTYLIDTNLGGTLHCLEHLRRRGGALVFLSTSRVFPIVALRALPLKESGERLVIEPGAQGPGWSEEGITEDFTLRGSRSLYGATKLASELMIEEYGATYGLKAVINRCGVLAGPWQMGKVDQGFVVLWLAQHLYGGALGYSGFGGTGLQVRDMLHVADLYDLIEAQWRAFDSHAGQIYNVGGGAERSVSLRELTALCRRITNKTITIGRNAETRPADIPYYVSDSARVCAATGWKPRRSVETILEDIAGWLYEHRAELVKVLG